MLKWNISLLICFLTLGMMAQDKPAYRIFDQKGKSVDYATVLKAVGKKDVVFFGELHNNPIAHWLQIELTKDLFVETKGKLVLGAEMFERDDQLLIDEYFAGHISEKSFEDEARTWPNYDTDYKPLVEFARAHELPFIATNIPRRYASLVFREGIEALNALSDEAKRYIAPLPIEIDLELPAYADMMGMMGGHAEGNVKFPQAQAIKDATMAYSIFEHLPKKHQFLHYNGSYHSDRRQGIIWYLDQYAPKLSYLSVKTIEQESLEQLSEDQKGTADYIIVIPQSMTKTY
ncbi:MAG TPA: ChaN family lipoprotein [Saprospiraceae bacterium]|nr:ChaN family lipoprotein [Saprospiraceae bacterium]